MPSSVPPEKSDLMKKIDSAGKDNRSANVVVIDPNSFSLLVLAGVLDSNGLKCICGRDSSAAIKSLEMGPQDLIVWDVGEDATEVLETLDSIRKQPGYENMPAVLLADSKWAGLEKKVENLPVTRCLFKPIDHPSLVAVAEQLLWMPNLVDAHRRRGSRPSRAGWVTL